ncbi:MAG: DUF58 domain-containing protein [Cytophagaceae bacterium]|nr:DUF58 domain-containing protein [Cytophagaceae bacterium]|tara:strand:- start:3522 stop:4454 length:933 start_codon:yes stop_codon:yes gene_type:complete
MDIQAEINSQSGFGNLELLASQVVEGFISGMHKSPFHGFSAEFAEHKVYNTGESTKHIDWKLYARTDKLYTKRYEEETNLRCHLILDDSSSMHYPPLEKNPGIANLNKVAFSVLASAAIMNLMKKQRDAVGMSIYGKEFEFYAPEKGSERHHHMLLDQLNRTITTTPTKKQTDTYANLHFIAEKLKRRSLVFLFSDMLQHDKEQDELFSALQHLKYNKHEVILFHTYDGATELNFDFDNAPKKFIDVESGNHINVFSDNIRENYKKQVQAYFTELRMRCAKFQIKYLEADIQRGFGPILTTFLVERQRFQ